MPISKERGYWSEEGYGNGSDLSSITGFGQGAGAPEREASAACPNQPHNRKLQPDFDRFFVLTRPQTVVARKDARCPDSES